MLAASCPGNASGGAQPVPVGAYSSHAPAAVTELTTAKIRRPTFSAR
jgi:hypothetical protein